KTAVIDIVCGYSPLRQTVGLRLDQLVQRIEASRVTRVAVQRLDGLFEIGFDFRGPGTECREPAFLNFLLAVAFRNALGRDLVAARQMPEGGTDAVQLEHIIVSGTERAIQHFHPAAENTWILSRIDWKPVLKIKQAELALFRIEHEFQVAALQHIAVLVSEDRNQNFSLEFILNR